MSAQLRGNALGDRDGLAVPAGQLPAHPSAGSGGKWFLVGPGCRLAFSVSTPMHDGFAGPRSRPVALDLCAAVALPGIAEP